jgi:hypothetical protein
MFDDLFQWLFAAVDIEKRPLQVIGAIAGLMAALMWLGFVVALKVIRWAV